MKKNIRILIVSRWCTPAKNPRAFRTASLIKEAVSRGYDMDIFIPEGSDVSLEGDGVRIHYVPVGMIDTKKNTTKKTNRIDLVGRIRTVFTYFFGDGPKTLLYSIRMLQKLFQQVRYKNYDMLISISYPFYIHIVASFFCGINKKIKLRIADCGDPFYSNPSSPKAFYLKYIERLILRQFDYITIPEHVALPAYQHCDIDDRIRVVHQGFRIVDVDKDAYRKNTPCTFCYAGVFYKKIRNPEFFFQWLTRIDCDFCFVVYALPDAYTVNLLMKYKDVLKEKLHIRDAVDREELIFSMAKMDFLINFNNENSTQQPSKLIDYAMSRRPILSFNRQTFRPEVFQAFLTGDYREQYHVDLEQYDIRRVVDQFEALFHEKTKE